MNDRLRAITALVLLGVAGAGSGSCGSREKPGDSPPVLGAPQPTTTAAACEEGWLSDDVKQATYTLRAGRDEEFLGDQLAVGDLDGDGQDDFATVGNQGEVLVHVVLGRTLLARPPGEYAIADVADYTIVPEAVYLSKVDLVIAGGALYVSTQSGSGTKPSYRVPFSALSAGGPGPHAVAAFADATFKGDSDYSQYVHACDIDGDAVGDLLVGGYVLMGEARMSGAVDLDAAGHRVELGTFGPCVDLDGDGKDDLTASVYKVEGEISRWDLHVWYGSSGGTLTNPSLGLGAPDVMVRVDPPPEEIGKDPTWSMGVSADAVGDWNGDGNMDLALEVHGGLPGARWSQVVLFLGEPGFRPRGTTLTRADVAVTVVQDGTISLGRTLAMAGDLNGDGRDDLVLSAVLTGYDSAYVRYCPLDNGTWSYLDFAQVTLSAEEGVQLGLLGHQALTHGDLDGNGVNDLVLTAPLSAGSSFTTGTPAEGDPSGSGAVLVFVR